METYLDTLRRSAKETGSIACMGLDIVVEAIPGTEKSFSTPAITYFKLIFDRMQSENVLPGSFKPNLGFYRTHDEPKEGLEKGSELLRIVIRILNHEFPQIPLILDAKTGDIAKSSANYAEACHRWGANATTVSPYMGTDSVMPYAEHTLTTDRPPMGSYVLCRTSNPGAKDFQDLPVLSDDGTVKPLYMHVAGKIVDWSKGHPGIGAVVGATSLEELTTLATLFQPHEIPLLIPGVGRQGGSAAQVMDVLRAVGYELELVRINSSSGLTHPWHKKGEPAPENYAEVVVQNLRNLNEAIGYTP